MSQLLEEHDELLAASGREVTLSTGAILSIFLGLALLCGLFFGFGYNIGRKSATAAALAAVPAEPSALSPSTPDDAFGKFKPSAATTAAKPAAASATPPAETPSASVPSPAPEPRTSVAAAPHSEVGAKPATARSSASGTPASVEAPSPVGPVGTFFVQVAAVSHSEDASLLIGALRARGYVVAQRSEPGDKLIHIQVGPFSSKPAAEAMRQRLQNDGYNPIIK